MHDLSVEIQTLNYNEISNVLALTSIIIMFVDNILVAKCAQRSKSLRRALPCGVSASVALVSRGNTSGTTPSNTSWYVLACMHVHARVCVCPECTLHVVTLHVNQL